LVFRSPLRSGCSCPGRTNGSVARVAVDVRCRTCHFERVSPRGSRRLVCEPFWPQRWPRGQSVELHSSENSLEAGIQSPDRALQKVQFLWLEFSHQWRPRLEALHSGTDLPIRPVKHSFRCHRGESELQGGQLNPRQKKLGNSAIPRSNMRSSQPEGDRYVPASEFCIVYSLSVVVEILG
jgi:hypothetical protein